MYEIKSEDLYAELEVVGKKWWFDFSNFSPIHPLYDDSNKRIPGLFKDKCNV